MCNRRLCELLKSNRTVDVRKACRTLTIYTVVTKVTQMLHSKLTKEKKSHKVLILLTLLESHFDVTIEWE